MVIPVNKLILEFYTQNNKRSEIVSNEIIWTSRLAPNDYEEEFRERGIDRGTPPARIYRCHSYLRNKLRNTIKT